MRNLRVLSLFLLILLMDSYTFLHAEESPMHSFIPEDGFIPNEETAIAVAEAILTPIYGKETVQREKPFKAVLDGEIWMVTGSLSKGIKGGVAIVQIAKTTAQIVRVSHGK